MSTRKVAPANLGFAQNADIVGRVLHRRNTAVETIFQKYINYIKEVKDKISQNKSAIDAVKSSLSLLKKSDKDTSNDILTIDVFSKILNGLTSNNNNSSSNNNNKDNNHNNNAELVINDLLNIILQCVNEYVQKKVTKNDIEVNASKLTQKISIDENEMNNVNNNEKKIDDHVRHNMESNSTNNNGSIKLPKQNEIANKLFTIIFKIIDIEFKLKNYLY